MDLFDKQYFDATIETFALDSSAKNQFRNEIVPIYGVLAFPKIDLILIDNMIEQFAAEINCKSKYFKQSLLTDILAPFANTCNQLLQLSPNKVSVQATTAPGIYLLAVIKGQSLHIDLNFSEKTGKFEEAVLNIFLKKTHLLNTFGTIEDIMLAMEQYFAYDRSSYEFLIRSSYAISDQTYSSFTF